MKPPPSPSRPLTLQPIGYVRSPHDVRYHAPRQPEAGPVPVTARVVLEPGHNFEAALADLDGFEKVWLVVWFDRNEGWRPKVLPPRGPRVRRGVFSTRSPHRPNPLGLSLVTLHNIKGRTLYVGDVDLLDGTPVLDIKPYLPYAEAHPTARAGWLDPVMADEIAGAARRFAVVWGPLAQAQRDHLFAQFHIDLQSVVDPTLGRDPSEHRHYRRVMDAPNPADGRMMAVRSWRVYFAVGDRAVTVHRLGSGYARDVVTAAPVGTLLDDAAHRDFHARWPNTSVEVER